MSDTLKLINSLIIQSNTNKTSTEELNFDANQISDGYHTFGELYEHRVELYIMLCRLLANPHLFNTVAAVWRSVTHSDGTLFEGWFLLGVNKTPGFQITYHVPMKKWDSCSFAETLAKAPEFDKHSSKDVLERLWLQIKCMENEAMNK